MHLNANEDWWALLEAEGGRFRICLEQSSGPQEGDDRDWWSPGLLRLFETAKPLPLPSLFEGYDRTRIQAVLASLQEGEQFHFTGLSANRPFRMLKISAQLQKGASSDESHAILFGVIQDVVVPPRTPTQYVESEVFLETVLDNLPHMVFVKDAEELRFVRFNKVGERLLGVKNADVLGKNDYDFFPKEQADAFTAKDREVLQQRTPVNIPEEPIETPSGQRFLHTQKITITDNDDRPRYLLGISIDITDSKRSQELIEKQRERLVHASRLGALGEMAGGIAHEINNPLAIISAACQHLEMVMATGDLKTEVLQRNFEMIRKTVDRIAQIISGLRDFSRDGRKDPFQATSICDVLKSTLPFCNQRFLIRGINLDIEFPPDAWMVKCQPVRISQVLLNLLNNAYDAVVESHNEAKRVQVRIFRDLDKYRILVIDNGVGVSSKIERSIMMPFFTTKPIGKGTGLGLSISAGIVKDHGGELSFRSLKDGAEFCIEMPLIDTEEVPS